MGAKQKMIKNRHKEFRTTFSYLNKYKRDLVYDVRAYLTSLRQKIKNYATMTDFQEEEDIIHLFNTISKIEEIVRSYEKSALMKKIGIYSKVNISGNIINPMVYNLEKCNYNVVERKKELEKYLKALELSKLEPNQYTILKSLSENDDVYVFENKKTKAIINSNHKSYEKICEKIVLLNEVINN